MPKKSYQCSNCKYISAKWYGKCPNCEAWNSFEEKTISESQEGKHPEVQQNKGMQLQTFEQVLENLNKTTDRYHIPFKSKGLAEFWHKKGISSDSLTLLAGEPGLGKSTFALQLLGNLHGGSSKKPKLIYITAEESVIELARRSRRLDIPKQVMVLQANNYEQIQEIIIKHPSDLVIVDSIQTIFSSQISSSPGSVSQVSGLAAKFLALSKNLNLAIILIGHVTKEGQIAGPKSLEHLVDSVLLLEKSRGSEYRTLTFNKHRYGSTDQQLLLKMKETGLEIVNDPSLALLENLESGIGVCYGLALEKNLPMVVEIQALVGSKVNNSGYGKREAIGLKTAKLNTITAIIEKYLGLDLGPRDIYLQLTGTSKNLVDDSLDLPIMLTILSSLSNRFVKDILNQKSGDKNLFAGRLTLSGKIRKATEETLREKTAN